MKRICYTCKEEKDLQVFSKEKRTKTGYSYLCKECDKERAKKYKEKNIDKWKDSKKRYLDKKVEEDPDFFKKRYIRFKEKILKGYERYIPTHRKEINARNLINLHIRRGKLMKPNHCSNCLGISKKIEAHHEDYNKPLEIIWVCSKCHNLLDKR
jgi:hypothetical protein